MKYLFIILFLTGCSVHNTHTETKSSKPLGEKIFSALLNHGNINLKNEPLCKANINLIEQLSLALSVSYESENRTMIKSFCAPSKHDYPSGKVIDIWDCTFQISEIDKQDEFISNSTFVFSLTTDYKEYIKGSLRCL